MTSLNGGEIITNKCQNCEKELKPDSSYYADDGDETFWYTDQYPVYLFAKNVIVI